MTDLRVRSLVRETLRSPATDTQPDLVVRSLVREVLRSPSADTQPDLRIQSFVRECLRSPRGATTPHVKKAKFTVQSSKVTGSSISNYVVFLTEQHLPASIFNSTYGARTDGGDIRAYSNSAAATEYPIDVVIFDKTNQKALICVKLPSVGSGANTDFYLFWGWPALTGYAVGDPYGRWNVWVDYSFVAFFDGTALTADRTSGNRTLTFAGSPSAVDGPYSKATRFNGTTGSMIASSTTVAIGAQVTITVVAKRVGNGDANARIVTARAGAATQGLSIDLLTGASDVVSASSYTSGGVATTFGSASLGAGWNEIVLESNTTGPLHELFVNNVSVGSDNAAVRATTTAGRVAAASSLTTSSSENAQVDIGLILIEPRISSDRRTTGKTNRDDPGFVDTTVQHIATPTVTTSPTIDRQHANTHTFELTRSPVALLGTEFIDGGGGAQEYELELQLTTSPIALLTAEIAKQLELQVDMSPALQRATSRTFSTEVQPVPVLDSSWALLRELGVEVAATITLQRAITKVRQLTVAPIAALLRGLDLSRSIEVQPTITVQLGRDITVTREVAQSPTASLQTARSIARTLQVSVTAAISTVRGWFDASAITRRVLRVPAEDRILVLPRDASRILVVPRENRFTRLAREVRRMVTPTPEDRILTIPAEPRRVITLPADESRVIVVPPE